jgi:hypothetical protein
MVIGTSEVILALSIIIPVIFLVLILRLLFKLKWK